MVGQIVQPINKHSRWVSTGGDRISGGHFGWMVLAICFQYNTNTIQIYSL